MMQDKEKKRADSVLRARREPPFPTSSRSIEADWAFYGGVKNEIATVKVRYAGVFAVVTVAVCLLADAECCRGRIRALVGCWTTGPS